MRTLLKAEATFGDWSLVAEGLDARRLAGGEDEPSVVAGQLNAAEILQGHVAWTPKEVLGAKEAEIALGRFTMDIGGRRLVARSGFSSVPVSFDGVRAKWADARGRMVTAFIVSPVDKRPSDRESLLDNEIAADRRVEDARFSGLWASMPLAGGLIGDITALSLDEEDDLDAQTNDRRLTTVAARLAREAAQGAVDLDIEAALQTGTARFTANPADTADLEKDAWMIHAEAGYSLRNRPVRISVHYDAASGDQSPADRSDERFDPLYGDRSFELGPTSIFGAVARTNLSSFALRLEADPSGPWDFLAAVRTIRLQSATDAFGASGIRDPSGTSGADVGDQLEWQVRRWIVKDRIRAAVGGAVLRRGEFMKNAPSAPDSDSTYSYADITWTF